MSESTIQLRFGLEKREIKNIFAEPEIAPLLDVMLAENKEWVTDFIMVVKKLLIALPNDELKREAIRTDLISDHRIIIEFQDNLLYRILHSAVLKALTFGFYDIKQNIIDMLSKDSEKIQRLLTEAVIVTISSLTKYEYDDILKQTFL